MLGVTEVKSDAPTRSSHGAITAPHNTESTGRTDSKGTTGSTRNGGNTGSSSAPTTHTILGSLRSTSISFSLGNMKVFLLGSIGWFADLIDAKEGPTGGRSLGRSVSVRGEI